MKDDRKYVRVYYSIRSDERFETIYGDDIALACWLRLLLDADAAWPEPASVPKAARQRSYRKLVAVGLIEELPGHLYRVHGLDRERDMRAHSGRIAAAVRWHSERNANGNAESMPRRAEQSIERSYTAEVPVQDPGAPVPFPDGDRSLFSIEEDGPEPDWQAALS